MLRVTRGAKDESWRANITSKEVEFTEIDGPYLSWWTIGVSHSIGLRTCERSMAEKFCAQMTKFILIRRRQALLNLHKVNSASVMVVAIK